MSAAWTVIFAAAAIKKIFNSLIPFMNSKRIVLSAVVILFLSLAFVASAQQPRIIYSQTGDINITSPEISQDFFDELKGTPRDYFINSDRDFELYINLLVPEVANMFGRYSMDVYLMNGDTAEPIVSIDGNSFEWEEYFDSYGRDYYMKGPEFLQKASAGKYKIEVYSKDNQGKYVLAVGQKESYDAMSILNIYWQLPLLKTTFFKTSVLQFFLTPFGIAGIAIIGGILILLALINLLIGMIKLAIKHNLAKTMLLTSDGMQMKDEIVKLLQKPTYDVTVAFINTAYKYEMEENPNYKNPDLGIMRDVGFNVEEVDIEGKKEAEVMKLLEMKDIIFVAGGNTYYLLKVMRECNFEKVIRKLLKWGKVYIGSSAGSIVAGRTIRTAAWKESDKNYVGLKDLRGLNLVPFDIFVHYEPEWAEKIKQEIKNPKKREKQLKIITDGQAILVQGKEVDLIGRGEAIIV